MKDFWEWKGLTNVILFKYIRVGVGSFCRRKLSTYKCKCINISLQYWRLNTRISVYYVFIL